MGPRKVPKARQAEEEEEHEHLNGHKILAAGNEEDG